MITENPSGLDIKRIQGLTDATFAVAMTIIILEINISEKLEHAELLEYIRTDLLPSLFIYLLSFIVLGAFWIDTHFHHNLQMKTDRLCSWLNILFLMFICIIPFSSQFLMKYKHDQVSTFFYCVNLLCASVCHLAMLIYAWKRKYMKPFVSGALYRNMKIRILVPICSYCILAPFTFYISGWVRFLFIAPLLFQIFFGRSRKEITNTQTS